MDSNWLFVIIMILQLPSFVSAQFYMKCFSKLTHVPTDIPSNATKIYLNNNEIFQIEPGAFAFHTQCVKLRLDFNELTEVRNDMWTGLVALEYLSLEHNDIGYIAPSAFADLPNLKGLYLHNNKLTTLPENIFTIKQMPQLEILTLHENSLKRNELSWLRELCEGGQIQEYTIRGDDIRCTSLVKASHQKQPYVSAYKNNVAQLEHKTQDKKNHERLDLTKTGTQLAPTGQGQHHISDTSDSWISADETVGPITVMAADSITDVVTWILIGTGVAIILIGAAILVALRSRALLSAGHKAKKIKPPTTFQSLKECRILLEPSNPPEPELTQINNLKFMTYSERSYPCIKDAG